MRGAQKTLFALCLIFSLGASKIYFLEEFGEGWEDRWVKSDWKQGEQGEIKVTAGKWYGDEDRDKGLQVAEDMKFYDVSAKFDSFSNKDKDLILQYTVKYEQDINCGGGYLKLLKGDFDQSQFGGDTEYNVMFGPDFCGSTKKTHIIIGYNGKNLELKKDPKKPTKDKLTHLFTLQIKPDSTYEAWVDNQSVSSGSLEDSWDFLVPKTIKDPSDKKPSDWVDNEYMDDPEDEKPEGYDDIPKTIADPEDKKPEDWDDEEDGEWEPRQIPNPEYKGEWKPKQIKNPDYKGKWEQKEIPNPDYVEDKELYLFDSISGIGIDIWQVKAGTIFDNILIGDDLEEAREHAKKTWEAMKDDEKEMHDDAKKNKDDVKDDL